MDGMVMSYPEKVWIGFDWKQAEMYFLSLFSKDIALVEALYSKDFHKYVASLLDGVSIEEVNGDQREMAKTLSYNLIYSGFNIPITKNNILKKRRDLTEDQVSEALEKYQETFFCLFNWVKQAAVDWHINQGFMTYFMRAKKFISVPGYLPCEPDKILNSYPGRLCINTYGQGSVGLLLKYVYSNMFVNPVVREHTCQHIPIFDGFYCLVDTECLDIVMDAIHRYTTPTLIHEEFNIKMAVDWKLSTKSWGDMKSIEYSGKESDIIYSW